MQSIASLLVLLVFLFLGSKAEEVALDVDGSASPHRRNHHAQQATPTPTANNASANGTNGTAAPPTPPPRTAKWEYCDGGPTVPEAHLYSVPGCQERSMQQPRLNRTEVAFAAFELRNLSFCCKANYTAILPVGTDIEEKDREAAYLFEEARLGLLARHPCEYFYPYQTCDPCLYAYRTWVCAITFPAMCRGSGFADEAIKVCHDVCLEVQKRCPFDFGVDCPDDDSSFYGRPSEAQLNYARDTGQGLSVSAAGCNVMHYDLWARAAAQTSGAAAEHASHRLLAILLVAVSAIYLRA